MVISGGEIDSLPLDAGVKGAFLGVWEDITHLSIVREDLGFADVVRAVVWRVNIRRSSGERGAYLGGLIEESRSSLLRFLLMVGDIGISAIEGMFTF